MQLNGIGSFANVVYPGQSACGGTIIYPTNAFLLPFSPTFLNQPDIVASLSAGPVWDGL